MVAFAYDYCILVAQVVERCKRGAEHGVCAHKGVTAGSVKLRKTALDRSYVRYNAAIWQIGEYLVKSRNRALIINSG